MVDTFACVNNLSMLSIIVILHEAGVIVCEHPNNSLYTFTGNLEISKQTIPITPNQILLRVSLNFAAISIISFAVRYVKVIC